MTHSEPNTEILYPNTAKAALQRHFSMPQYYAWRSAFLGNHDMTRRTLDRKFAGITAFTPAQAAEIAQDLGVEADTIFQYDVTLKNMEP